MGQNSVIFLGLFVFGMTEMLVLLISDIGRLLLSTFKTMLVTLFPIMFQYFLLKKIADIPSSPGALVG